MIVNDNQTKDQMNLEIRGKVEGVIAPWSLCGEDKPQWTRVEVMVSLLVDLIKEVSIDC